MSQLAPIAFFVYKRPEHTLQALTALSQNDLAKESHLFIYSDGPKTSSAQADVLAVRRLIASQKWCGEVDIIERSQNLGLANSIISGVTSLCNTYGKVIVLEDDLVTSSSFLSYMNSALDRYAIEPRVMQISGHMFPVRLNVECDACFLPFTTTWGWATWQRAWQYFDPEMRGYACLQEDATLKHKFDLDGAYPYFNMLKQQAEGKIDSWGIRWYLSVFLKNGLVLFPIKSLIMNHGLDGTGTHKGGEWSKINPKIISGFYVSRFPETISSDEEVNRSVSRTIIKINRPGFYNSVHSMVARLISRKKSLRK